MQQNTANPQLAPPNGPQAAADDLAGAYSKVSARVPGNAVAFLASLVLHVSLLLILACWVLRGGLSPENLSFTANFSEPSSSASLQMTVAPDVSAPASAETPVSESAPEQKVMLAVDLPGISAESVSESRSGIAASLVAVSAGEIAGGLAKATEGRGASFFGTNAYGNRFVYVLDSSTSMMGQRWKYACDELLRSLSSLEMDQQFFIICFDLDTTLLFDVPPGRAKFLTVDDITMRRVRGWLRSRQLGPSTRPAEALRLALDFSPDAIFFLSDGELRDASRSMLRKINGYETGGPQIPIHSIHLFSEDGRETLEMIAMENDGTFTHIDNFH